MLGATERIQVRINADASSGVRAIDQTAASVSKLTSVTNQARRAAAGWASEYVRVYSILRGAQSVVGAARDLLATAAALEKLQLSLTRFVGTADQASAAMAMFKDIGKESFGITEVGNAFIRLHAVGLTPTHKELRGIVGYMMLIGKTSSEAFDESMRLVSSLSQLGNVGMEDVLEEVVKVFPFALTALKEKLDISMMDILYGFKKGAFDMQTIIKAIMEYAGENYEDGIERMGKTWDGVVMRLRGRYQEFVLSLEQSGALRSMSDVVIGWINEMDRLSESGKFEQWAERFSVIVSEITGVAKDAKHPIESLGDSLLLFTEIVGKLPAMALKLFGTNLERLGEIVRNLNSALDKIPPELRGMLTGGVAGLMLTRSPYGAAVGAVAGGAMAERSSGIGNLVTNPPATPFHAAAALVREFIMETDKAKKSVEGVGEAVAKAFKDPGATAVKGVGGHFLEGQLMWFQKLQEGAREAETMIERLRYKAMTAGKTEMDLEKTEIEIMLANYTENWQRRFDAAQKLVELARAATAEGQKAGPKALEDAQMMIKALETELAAVQMDAQEAIRLKGQYWDMRAAERAEREAGKGVVRLEDVDQNLRAIKQMIEHAGLEVQSMTSELAQRGLVAIGDIAAAENERIHNEVDKSIRSWNENTARIKGAVKEMRDRVLGEGKKPQAGALAAYGAAETELAKLRELEEVMMALLEKYAQFEQAKVRVKQLEGDSRVANLKAEYAEIAGNLEQQLMAEKELVIVERDRELASRQINGATQEELDLVRKVYDARAKIKELELSGSFWDGMRRAMQDSRQMFTEYQLGMDIMNSLRNSFSEMGTALAEFARTGKMNFREFAMSVIADIMNIISRFLIMRLLFGASGSGGLIGSWFPTGHGGGLAQSLKGASRFMDPGIFAFAPRLHSGHLGSDEYPAILRKDESVLTPEQLSRLRGGTVLNSVVNVSVSGGSAGADRAGAEGLGQEVGRVVRAEFRRLLMEEQRIGGSLNSSRRLN